jgi:hypothetical protein
MTSRQSFSVNAMDASWLVLEHLRQPGINFGAAINDAS